MSDETDTTPKPRSEAEALGAMRLLGVELRDAVSREVAAEQASAVTEAELRKASSERWHARRKFQAAMDYYGVWLMSPDAPDGGAA